MMSKFAQTLLAAMINLIHPGKSIYSRSVLPSCDQTCQQTPVCEGPSPICKPPEFSPAHKGYTVAESPEDGLQRYAIIATAIDEVSKEMTWTGSTGDVDCSPFTKEYADMEHAPAVCKQQRRAHPWMGNSRDLAHLLVTVAYHESGFRRDVHTGKGPASRGDCDWVDEKTGHRRAPGAKGAVMRGCRSVCLGQINLGSGVTMVDGWKAADLLGDDIASTKRCLVTAARALSFSQRRCSGMWSGAKSDWAKATLTAYGTGGSCWMGSIATGEDGRFVIRGKTFWKISKNPMDLEESIKAQLGLLPPPSVPTPAETPSPAAGEVVAGRLLP